MMPIRDVERWAIQVLDTVQTQKFREDAFIELKVEWPDAYKTARRIAGHSNAARGSDILWIIGADEKRGLVGVQTPDLASWLPQLWQHFDGVHPASTDVEIEFAGVRCTALSFDTSRAPYIVKNPDFGKLPGIIIEREIPWRDGTRIRTATRDEVLRLLVDTITSPSIEVFSAVSFLPTNRGGEREEGIVKVRFFVQFYLMPRSFDPLVIPHHHIEGFVTLAGDQTRQRLHQFTHSTKESQTKSLRRTMSRVTRQQNVIIQSDPDVSLEDTGSELVITRACHVHCYADAELPREGWEKNEAFDIQITYFVGPDRVPFVVSCSAKKKAERAN